MGRKDSLMYLYQAAADAKAVGNDADYMYYQNQIMQALGNKTSSPAIDGNAKKIMPKSGKSNRR